MVSYFPDQHLAWHETMDLHELVALSWVGLIKLKKTYREVQDPELRHLYGFSIQSLEHHLLELTAFYPAAPRVSAETSMEPYGAFAFQAGDLLALAKTAVRSYAIAITETATPALRQVLLKQMVASVHWHEMVYNYMYSRGLYPSYNLNQLLEGDLRNVHQALSMPY